MSPTAPVFRSYVHSPPSTTTPTFYCDFQTMSATPELKAEEEDVKLTETTNGAAAEYEEGKKLRAVRQGMSHRASERAREEMGDAV